MFFSLILAPDTIWNNTFATDVLDHKVAIIHDLTDLRKIIAVLIVPIIARSSCQSDGLRLLQARVQLLSILCTFTEHVTLGIFLFGCTLLQDELLDFLLLLTGDALPIIFRCNNTCI